VVLTANLLIPFSVRSAFLHSNLPFPQTIFISLQSFENLCGQTVNLKVTARNILFEVHTAVKLKTAVFWFVTPCRSVKIHRRFGGTYRPHLQHRRLRESEPCFFFGLPFDNEYRGNMVLRNARFHTAL
jgi:hypothetical protein